MFLRASPSFSPVEIVPSLAGAGVRVDLFEDVAVSCRRIFCRDARGSVGNAFHRRRSTLDPLLSHAHRRRRAGPGLRVQGPRHDRAGARRRRARPAGRGAPASFLARAHRSGAELKTQLDLAFGARLQSEYVFRGVSLGRPGVEAYGEARFVDGLVYAGLSAHAAGLNDTVAGVNVGAGFRPRVGPLSFDLGVVRYHRPRGGERAFAFGPVAPAGRTDFFELGAGAAYAVDAALTVGARVAYAPDWFGSGRPASYGSLRAHYRLPEALVAGLPPGFALSGELGRMTIGGAAAGARIPTT